MSDHELFLGGSFFGFLVACFGVALLHLCLPDREAEANKKVAALEAELSRASEAYREMAGVMERWKGKQNG